MFPTVHGVVAQVLAAAPPPAPSLGGRAWHSETTWSSGTSTWQLGWRFTVGAADIEVGALMAYRPAAGTETVRIWRVSDETVVASADVTTTGGWGEEEITPVTLSAGADYVITIRDPSAASRTYGQNADRFESGVNRAVIFDPSITYVGNRYVDGATYPTNSLGNMAGVNFRTPAPASGYRFYRLHFTAASGGSRLRVDEVELRATVGGADETGSGAGWADSIASSSFPGSNAFSNTTAQWVAATSVVDASLYYDFGTSDPQSIAQYAIKASTTPGETPSAWTLEGSNDLVTWDTLDTVSGETGWSSGETRTFSV